VGPLTPAVPVAVDVAWMRIDDAGAAGGVRRAAAALGAELGLTDNRVAELAILATEIATNLHRHADGGLVLLRSLRVPAAAGVELVALDSGPGMADALASRRDGHSTTGTLGIGLGAIERLATTSDLYSLPGKGTVATAQVWPAKMTVDAPAQGLTKPMTGESVSGDAWSARFVERLQLMVCDGLGHGPLAANASRAATDAFAIASGGPAIILEQLHRAMSRTRGGAVAVAELDPTAGVVRFAGLGNIAGYIVTGGAARNGSERRGMVSLPGIAGHQRRSVREFSYPVEPGDLVILHSDGVTDKWRLADYPGLLTHTPLTIAATLLRDAGVRRDDVSVLVVRVPP
jgi:anti-sigma regulatory factor (Ser/Thr protein kinase)